MKGFWETWLHIFVGAIFIAAFSWIVFVIYDIGRIHGRAAEYKAVYEYGYEVGKERGYENGYHDGLNHKVPGWSK